METTEGARGHPGAPHAARPPPGATAQLRARDDSPEAMDPTRTTKHHVKPAQSGTEQEGPAVKPVRI
jgi:hypothetical protein